MRVHDAVRSIDHQMHARRTAGNMLRHDLLHRAADRSFTSSFVGKVEPSPWLRSLYWLGTEWKSQDREQEAGHRPRDHSFSFRHTTTLHAFSPQSLIAGLEHGVNRPCILRPPGSKAQMRDARPRLAPPTSRSRGSLSKRLSAGSAICVTPCECEGHG